MIQQSDYERELKRISGLVQNKGKCEDELAPQARINLIIREFKREPMFPDTSEQKLAEERYAEYLKLNELESVSDLDTLRSLVFNEVLEARIQKELNNLAQQQKYPPDKLVKTLTDIQDQKAKIKGKLGIDKKEEELDELTSMQLLHKRVDKYINDHKEEFTFGLGFECEKCNHKNWETFLLYKRVKLFDGVIKHPWFVGRWLFNFEIMKDVKSGKLSKEDALRYLMCSGEGKFYKPAPEDKKWCADYIDYLLTNWTEITDLLNKK